MKNRGMKIFSVVGLMAGMLAFTSVQQSGIKGMVTPADGVKDVVAISGTDTIKAVHSGGSFSFSPIKAGKYTVMVKAMTPYKDAWVENVVVTDTAVTDLGEIKLLQTQ